MLFSTSASTISSPSARAEGLLIAASRAGRFGRYQCEAAIQSVHIQRPITGRLNLAALRTLYDLLISQSDSIGARIGRALVMAETGDLDEALAGLDALPATRVERHQPWWVARARVLTLLGRRDAAGEALTKAIALTEDEAVRRHLRADRSSLSAPDGTTDQ